MRYATSDPSSGAHPAPRAAGPAWGAIVMATGIVSVSLSLDGREILADVLLALTALIWFTLGLSMLWRVAVRDPGLRGDARSPLALTGVAGTAVLATALTERGWTWAGVALLSIASALWLALLLPVGAALQTPFGGSSLMLAVSTEALAVLCAALAADEHLETLLDAGLALSLLGLAGYLLLIAKFDLRELRTARGVHWITGGAVAISTLAIARTVLVAVQLHALRALLPALKDLIVVLWCVSIVWLAALIAAETLYRRPYRGLGRWSSVFPIGMYAACSFEAGTALDAPAITSFAKVWAWIALAAWAVVLSGAVPARLRAAGPPTRQRRPRRRRRLR